MAFIDYKGTLSRNSWISPEHDSSWEQRNPSGKVVIGNHCRVTNQLKFTPLWNSLPWNPKVFRLDHVRWNVLPIKKCMWMLYGNLKSVAPFCLFWNAGGLRGRDTCIGRSANRYNFKNSDHVHLFSVLAIFIYQKITSELKQMVYAE